MCGSSLGLSHKYDLDLEELHQLRELARTRFSSRHYGRGLRYVKVPLNLIGVNNV